MPVIAAVAIASGAIEVSAVVAGLTYASAGLYVVGKATGNEDLMKLSAVTGLAAGGVGLAEGLAGAGGAAINDAAHFSDAAFDAGNAGAASGVTNLAADGAAQTASMADPGSATQSFDPTQASSATGNSWNDVRNAVSDTGTGMTPSEMTMQGQQAPQTIPGATDAAASNTTGNTSSGMINQPAQPSADWTSGYDLPAGQMPTDPTMLGKVKDFWNSLDAPSKLAVSQFVAKGMGAIGDFVGPKADLMKAQAGLATANTGIINQQLANMAQPAVKIPNQTYTFTPRGA